MKIPSLGLLDAARPETIPDKVPTNLVQEMSWKTIEPLTKEGAVSQGLRDLGIGVAALVGGLVAGFFLLANPPSAAEASKSLAVFGWLGLLFLPVVPFLPVVSFFFAASGAVLLFRGFAQASAAKIMGSAEFHCPSCSQALSIARSRPKFDFVCTGCYALVYADAARPLQSQGCEYCGLTSFAPTAATTCPSCQHKSGVALTICAECSKPVPKDILFCRECLKWLGQPEVLMGSFTVAAKPRRAVLAHRDVSSRNVCSGTAITRRNPAFQVPIGGWGSISRNRRPEIERRFGPPRRRELKLEYLIG